MPISTFPSLRILSGLDLHSVHPNDEAQLRRSLEENELKELRQNPFFREQISNLNREQNLNLNTNSLYPLLRDDGDEPTIQVRDRTGKLWGIPVTDPALRSIHKRYMERCFGPALEKATVHLPSFPPLTQDLPALANTIPTPDVAPQREQLQLQDDIQGLEERLQLAEQEKQGNLSRIQELERALQSSQDSAQNNQREFTQLQGENRRLQEEGASLNADLRSARGRLQVLERSSLGEHRELLELRARVRELEQRIQGLEVERARNLGRIQQLETNLPIERAERGRIQRELQEALRQNGRLEAQNRQLNADLDQARRNLLHLEQTVVPELQHRIGNLQQNQHDLSYQRDWYQLEAESLGRQNAHLRRNLERANGLANEFERLRNLLAQREQELEQLRPFVDAHRIAREELASLQRAPQTRSAVPLDQVELERLQKRIEELEPLARSHDSAQAQYNDLRLELLSVAAERDQAVTAARNSLALYQSANDQLNASQASLKDLTARLEDLTSRHDAAQTAINETRNRLAAAQGVADQLAPTQRELIAAQASVRDLNQRLEGLHALYDAARARMSETHAQLRDAQRLAEQLEPTQRQLSSARDTVRELTARLGELTSQQATDQATLRDTRALLTEAQRQTEQLAPTQQQLTTALASAKALTARVAELTEQQRKAADELERTRELLIAAEARAAQSEPTQRELSTAQAENQALRAQLERVTSQHKADMATLKSEHAKYVSETEERLRDLQKSLTDKTEQFTLAEAAIKEKQGLLEAALSRAALLEPVQRDLEAVRGEIISLTSRLKASEQDQTALTVARKELAAALERASQLERVEQESAQAQEAVRSLKGELKELTARHERDLATIRETESRLASASEQYTQAQTIIAEQQRRISDLGPRLQKAERGLEEALLAVREAESSRTQSEARVRELEPYVKRLEETHASVEAQQKRITELSAQHEGDVTALRAAEEAVAAAKREVAELAAQKKAQTGSEQLEQLLAERERELKELQARATELSSRIALDESQMAGMRERIEQAQKQIAELEPKAQEWEKLTADLCALQEKSAIFEGHLRAVLAGIEASEPAALSLQLYSNSLEERVHNAQTILRAQRAREEALQSKNDELRASLETLRQAYENGRRDTDREHERELLKIKRESADAASDSQRVLTELRDTLTAQEKASRLKIAELDAALAKLTAENNDLGTRYGEIQNNNVRKQETINRLEAEIHESKKQLAEFEAGLERTSGLLRESNEQKEDRERKILSLEKEFAALNTHAKELRDQVSERDNKIDAMRKHLESLRNQLREYNEARNLLAPNRNDNLVRPSLSTEIGKLQASIAELTAQLETQEGEIHERIMEDFGMPLKRQVDSFNEEIARLRLEIAANRESAALELEVANGWVATYKETIDRHEEILTRMQARNRELATDRLRLHRENEELRASLAQANAQGAAVAAK